MEGDFRLYSPAEYLEQQDLGDLMEGISAGLNYIEPTDYVEGSEWEVRKTKKLVEKSHIDGEVNVKISKELEEVEFLMDDRSVFILEEMKQEYLKS